MVPTLHFPLKTTISITAGCNLNCRLCYSDCGQTAAADELSTSEWLPFIDYIADNGLVSVLIEGGEPLTRPDLFDILRASSRRMMTWLRTNGTLLTADICRDLKRAGVGTVLVDLLGARAQTHDELVGVRGSFRRAIAGIRHLRQAGIPVILLIILNRRNIAELPEYLRLAAELGVPKVGILRLYPLGRARRAWSDYACTREEMAEAIARLKPPKGVGVMQSWHPKNGNCCWENSAVTAIGDSVGCPYLREYVSYGNIRHQPFLKTWNHPLYRRLRAGPKSGATHCAGCAGTEGTRGGCRATAYAFHRDWDAPDPFCATGNEGVDLRALPDWHPPETV